MERKQITQNGANEMNALEAAQRVALETEKRSRRAMACAWASVVSMALVATIGMVEGCAHDRTSVSSNGSQSSSATPQAVVASTEGMQPGASSPVGQPVDSEEGIRYLAPDLVAAASDTFVTAGQGVEVNVQATPDVTEMALSDGRGDPLPMVRDSSSDTWRVDYRVPLRPKQNRVGLSVTAKNEHGKWARVWLFLTVDDGKQQVESVPDTTTQER